MKSINTSANPAWLDSNLYASNPDYQSYALARMLGATQADNFEAWQRGEDGPSAAPQAPAPEPAPVTPALTAPAHKIKRKAINPGTPSAPVPPTPSTVAPATQALEPAVVIADRTPRPYAVAPAPEDLTPDSKLEERTPRPYAGARASTPDSETPPSSKASTPVSETPPSSEGFTPRSETPPSSNASTPEPEVPPQTTKPASHTPSFDVPSWIAENRLPTVQDFDAVRYFNDEGYRAYVQSAVAGKTRAPSYEAFTHKADEARADDKMLEMGMLPMMFGGTDDCATNAVRIQIVRQTNARIAAHNHAIDVRQETAGTSSRLMTLNFKAFIEGRAKPPPYTNAMLHAQITEEHYLSTINDLRATYHNTRSQTDWGKVADTAVMGALTFGIAAVTLLDKDQRTKSGVKEAAVQRKLDHVNRIWREVEIPAQWHLQLTPGWPQTWELSLHRSPNK